MDKDRGCDFKLTADHGETAIVSGCGCCDSPWVSCEADARLIAAAPELLTGLEDAVLFLLGVGVSVESPIMERLALVIRKAKGLEQ